MTRTVCIFVLALILGACAGEQTRSSSATPERVRTGCVSETGTRIEQDKDKGKRCEAGRTYTREDLERSGGISTGEAIKRLMP